MYDNQIIYSQSAYSLKHIFSNKKGFLDWCYHVPTSTGINCVSLLCGVGTAQPADARRLMVINSCYSQLRHTIAYSDLLQCLAQDG